MLKGNCRKKNLTTCERTISSSKPAFRESVDIVLSSLDSKDFLNAIKLYNIYYIFVVVAEPVFIFVLISEQQI